LGAKYCQGFRFRHQHRQGSRQNFFRNWLTVKGGQTKTVTLVYKLPFKLANLDHFSLLAQKQIGAFASDFSYSLDFRRGICCGKTFYRMICRLTISLIISVWIKILCLGKCLGVIDRSIKLAEIARSAPDLSAEA